MPLFSYVQRYMFFYIFNNLLTMQKNYFQILESIHVKINIFKLHQIKMLNVINNYFKFKYN